VAPFLALTLSLLLMGISTRGTWTPDEPRVAAICREMSTGGSFVVPHLGGRPFVEKPPLYFAAGALSLRWLAPFLGDVGAVRATSVLFGLLTAVVAFFLARRLLGLHRALLSLLFLTTMYDFVSQTHWIRVDVALLFGITAAVWSFAEAYLGGRPWFLLLGGAFTALAFLGKGPIGPALIFPAWAGLFVPWLVRNLRRSGNDGRDLHLALHLGAAAVVSVLVLAWMVPFRIEGGPDVFGRWLVDNQFGRASGDSGLGHTKHAGNFLYYLGPLFSLAAPWSPLLLFWGARFLQPRARRPRLTPGEILLLIWLVGMLALLSLVSTKRSLYALPTIVPVALLCATAVPKRLSSVHRWFFGALMVAAVLALGGILLVQLVPSLIPLPDDLELLYDPLLKSPYPGLLIPIGFLLTLFLLFRPRRVDLAVRASGCAACLLAINMLAIEAIENRAEDMAPAARELAASIAEDPAARVATFNLGENEIGALSFSGHLILPLVSDEGRASRILEGQDPEFTSLLIAGKDGHESWIAAHPILHEVGLGNQADGKDRHLVLWMGQGQITDPAAPLETATPRPGRPFDLTPGGS
jgi:4-amino-4-deoxy-L-arabinose transferase-like glycosyltransferase